MLTQMLVNGFVQKEDVMASAYHEKRRKQLREKYGIAVTDDNVEVAQDADILLIGVKPQEYRNIIMEIRSVVKPEALVIAIAVGVTMDGIKDLFGKPVKLTRAMPNIAAQVGEGVTGFCTNFYVTDEAGVLSPETEKLICDYNGALEYQCKGAQIVVVAVNYLDGRYADEYATELFNAWRVGDAEENNGMLLLLGVQENKAWLTMGRGIDAVFDSNGKIVGEPLLGGIDHEENLETLQKMIDKAIAEDSTANQ